MIHARADATGPFSVAIDCRAAGSTQRRSHLICSFCNFKSCNFGARHLGAVALPVLVAAGLMATAPSAYATHYEFVPRRTEVRFSYTMGYTKQRGRFTKVRGKLDYDPSAPERSKVEAVIDAASLSTGEALVESELKGGDFFNVAAAPSIILKSDIVQAQSPTTAVVSGRITVNGTTRPVVLNVTLETHDDPALTFDSGALKFVAKTRIKRSAFNITAYQNWVGDDIELEIDAIVRPRRTQR